MKVTDELKEKIYKAVCEVAGACVPKNQIKLEHPEVEEYGDYSTNIAMVMASDLKTSPLDLAQKIAEKMQASVAGPGFINIMLQNDYFINEIERVITQGQDYGAGTVSDNGRVTVVEYSSPNIAKPFGIGHLRSTIIGQTLYNLYKFLGYKVIGDNHLGDWGTQFGKLLFMIDRGKVTDLSIGNLEKLYVEFHEHPEWEDEGRRWFKKLEEGDQEARGLWRKCVEVSMKEFDRIYDLLGVKIDNAYGESSYEELMKTVIGEAKSRGVAKESEGAWIIEEENLKTPLMLLKSDGGTTYATRDLATIKFRKERWNPDVVIYEVGAEQSLYFEQLFGAARLLGYVSKDTRLIHTKHGLYLDTDGKKFATRKGKTVKLEEVLEEAIKRAGKLGSKDTAKAVGIGAIKYFDLSHNIQSDIVFDWDKVMALEGNSGPYLQYTYARTRSVLVKAQSSEKIGASGAKFKVQSNYNFNHEEEAVLRWIYRFGEVVEESGERLAPNLVCNYLFELAQRFNTFYNKHSILGGAKGEGKSEGEETRAFRLALTAATGQVLKNGLGLLGIEALDRM